MRDEILGGLRNALEHGNTLEEAVKSFITAGYAPEEVQEAAQELSANVSSLVQVSSTQQHAPIQNNQAQPVVPPARIDNSPNPNKTQNTIPTYPPRIMPTVQNRMPGVLPTSPPLAGQKNGANKPLIIFLIILLFFLAGAVVLGIIYSQQLIDFVKGI